MDLQNQFCLGIPLTIDPNINPFSEGADSAVCDYGSSTTQIDGTIQQQPLFDQRFRSVTEKGAQPTCNDAVQYQHPAFTSTAQAAFKMNIWLQQDGLNFRTQTSQQIQAPIPGLGQTNLTTQAHASGATDPRPCPLPIGHGIVPVTASLPSRPAVNRDYARVAKKLKSWNLQMTDQLTSANQQLQSQHDTIADLKHRLSEQEKVQFHQTQSLGPGAVMSLYSGNLYMPQPAKPIMTRLDMYDPNFNMSPPSKSLSPVKSFEPLSAPSMLQLPPAPVQPPSKSGRHHHRTVTPEQRYIREIMGGKPVYTVGMKEQDDRCLFFDYFEHIKKWAAMYTVHIRSLNAEQVHNLAAHPAIAEVLGKSSQLMMLVTEKDMLIAMVTSVVSNRLWTHALDEHSLYASGHPQAQVCEELVHQWTRIGAHDHQAKLDLLAFQEQIYTSIKSAPDHNTWRTSRAESLSTQLLSDLDGLLATNISLKSLTERNHVLSELYIKGYRIGFRLRMTASKWQFQWPSSGTEFDPDAMVNENRMLYGDVMRTMGAVMHEPQMHEVRFAMSPTTTRSDFSVGGETRVVVHHAMVHITRTGWI